MNKIQDEFHSVGMIRGELLMLRPSDAIKMVKRYRECDIEILGIDGFILTPTTTQPTMEHSIDLSGSRKPANAEEGWKKAETFLNERLATDLFFEIIGSNDE